MEQINHHDDEHDQSSNEENTHTDHQQLLFKYLAESLQKQQQLHQQTGPIDFSTTSSLIKKEIPDDNEEDEDIDEEQEEEEEDTDMVKIFVCQKKFHLSFFNLLILAW